MLDFLALARFSNATAMTKLSERILRIIQILVKVMVGGREFQ